MNVLIVIVGGMGLVTVIMLLSCMFQKILNIHEKIKSMSVSLTNKGDDHRVIDKHIRENCELLNKINYHFEYKKEDSNKQVNAELLNAVSAVAHGIDYNTYQVLKNLISAVENNDVGQLSSVVHSAKHMCMQYDTAQNNSFKQNSFKLKKK